MKSSLSGLGLGFALALFALFSSSASAQEVCAGFSKAQDLIDCIQARHPDLQLSEVDTEIAKSSEIIARQRPNPELDSRILGGLGSNERFLSEINFSHTIELGGKRQSRIDQAKARQRLAALDLKSTRENVVLESILALYRLRQIQSERSVLAESASSLRHIQGLYQKRPLLDAEQQASKSVFQLVQKDIQLQEMGLLEEELRLKAQLEKALGQTIAWNANVLPKTWKSWPLSSNLAFQEPSQAIAIQKAESELDYAQASEKLVRSEAKPDLKIGPSVDATVQDRQAGAGLGVNFSIPLPLYHQNQGQKQQAQLQQKKAQLNLELTQKQKSLEAKQLLEAYSRLTKLLKASQGLGAGGAQHQEIEALFERGFISSTLILETHRQLIESKQKYHELELKSLEALWRLYALQGKIFEVKL